MGPVRTIIDTAWSDIQTRFGPLATAKSLPVPKYVSGASDWFSRMHYPALFRTTDFVRQETSGQLGEEISVNMDLVLVHTSAKPDALEDDMADYLDCMIELIRDDHTFGGACQIGEFVMSDFYAASQNDRDLAIAMISIRLHQEVQI